MNDFNYKKWNDIAGWITFAIALITYTLTLEPTVSPWDCGEYISTSANLSVGHPPGAPLFQMLGAFFAMFALESSQIAYMVNFMSGLASAFTILFMFWSITYLVKGIALKNSKFEKGEKIAVLGSGIVGALAYTFSDSFWFSAVEGEVYAMSSFLMALLFWLALRWISEINEPRGSRWLILISFVTGLSFGVHILSLLVIPSIVMLYFFKTYKKINLKTTAVASVISILVLAFVFKFLFPMTLKFFSVSELFFINSVGLPYNSGTIIAAIGLIVFFVFGLKLTKQKNLPLYNTLLLSVLFIMIGFSTWTMLPIRANANTTINENNPSSARELLAYYNREQYGDANIFYDKYYSITYQQEREQEKVMENGEYVMKDVYKDAKPKYEKRNGKYEIVNKYKNSLPVYSSKHKGFIPRMVDPSRKDTYKQLVGIPLDTRILEKKAAQLKSQVEAGYLTPQEYNEQIKKEIKIHDPYRRPTFVENIYFMLDYQFGYMYGRYFMWNFVGRQDDIQGHLDNHGNWLSGIKPLDEIRLGSLDELPVEYAENKGRNTYFFLPLILGLIGLIYQVRKDTRNWYVLALFFVFTGFAIIFYTNPKPFEPRERDYAVVGSFYIFAIWIGFGVYALYDALKKYGNKQTIAAGVSVLSLLAVPALMGFQNWDDHDRSDRYVSRFGAQAYLESCDENAILFTIGDNDTFPLWYLQEIEGIRTDIKAVNTSLFATDWYIDQMKKTTYKAPPIPSDLTHDLYKYGSLDVCYYSPEAFPPLEEGYLPLNKFMDFIKSTDERTYADLDGNGIPYKLLRSNVVRVPVNKENVLKYGIVDQKDADKIVDYIDIKIDGAIGKQSVLMLDILNNFDWKRPIYFTGGSSENSEYIWLKDYLQLDGMAFKLVPIKTPAGKSNILSLGRIDAAKMYENVKKWDWTVFDNDFYVDEQVTKNSLSLRNNMMRLSGAFAKEGDTLKAIEILDFSLKKLPIQKFGHYSISLEYPELYYKLKQQDKARKYSKELIGLYQARLDWYSTFSLDTYNRILDNFQADFYFYEELVNQIKKFDSDPVYIEKMVAEYNAYLNKFRQ